MNVCCIFDQINADFVMIIIDLRFIIPELCTTVKCPFLSVSSKIIHILSFSLVWLFSENRHFENWIRITSSEKEFITGFQHNIRKSLCDLFNRCCLVLFVLLCSKKKKTMCLYVILEINCLCYKINDLSMACVWKCARSSVVHQALDNPQQYYIWNTAVTSCPQANQLHV